MLEKTYFKDKHKGVPDNLPNLAKMGQNFNILAKIMKILNFSFLTA